MPPCLPYLGRYLSELLFIGDKYADQEDDMINFGKLSLIAGIIDKIQLYQREVYLLLPLPSVDNYVNCLGVEGLEPLWKPLEVLDTKQQ